MLEQGMRLPIVDPVLTQWRKNACDNSVTDYGINGNVLEVRVRKIVKITQPFNMLKCTDAVDATFSWDLVSAYMVVILYITKMVMLIVLQRKSFILCNKFIDLMMNSGNTMNMTEMMWH